ncbi:MAG TPA: serine/threonine-protein kinase [Polyangiaceae bacterium]
MSLSPCSCDPNRTSSIPVVEGQQIGGRYEVRSILAEGGMGVVCEAMHLELGVSVAVKFIRCDLADNPEIVQRFLNEARTAAALRSEHVARVYDAGRLETGEPYLVMEHLDGIGLDALLKEQGALEASQAVDLVLQACEGLAEAHALGLVHRDIKPANLFVTRRTDGRPFVKVLDFGVSKRLVDGHKKGLTDPSVSVGSPWYMSPEQMRNAASVNQRTDIWSLGILLFELLTGSHPFDGETIPEVCAKVLTARAPRLRSRIANVDPHLEEVVARCLQNEPEHRYATVSSLAEHLAPFGSGRETSSVLSDLGVGSTSLAPIEKEVRSRSSRRPSITAGALAMLGIGAYVGYLLEVRQDLSHFQMSNWSGSAVVRNFKLPGDPVLASEMSDDVLETMSTSSAAPILFSGVVGKGEPVLDRAGHSCAAAERERNAADHGSPRGHQPALHAEDLTRDPVHIADQEAVGQPDVTPDPYVSP